MNFSATTIATAAGRVLIHDKTNISVTKPGQYVMTGARVRASAGYRNFNGNNFGKFGGGGASLTANGKSSAAIVNALDTFFVSNPLPVYGNSTTFAAKRSTGLFWNSGDTPSGTMEFERPFTCLISERGRGPSVYLGDLMRPTAFGSRQVRATVQASSTLPFAPAAPCRTPPGVRFASSPACGSRAV